MKDLAPGRNRRAASVEQLLTWAYRDQRVHQARRVPVELGGGQGGPLAAHSTLWHDTAPIDGSKDQGFDAADDAWRIHALVMALGRYRTDCGDDLRAARYHALGQYRGAEPPIEGGTADRMARPWPTDGRLEIDLRALVMIHASRATRPALPGREPVRFKPAETVWHPKRRGGVYAKGWYRHITADGDLPGDRLKDWEVFTAWRGCLMRLQRDLQAITLTMFSVTDALPFVPERPRSPLD